MTGRPALSRLYNSAFLGRAGPREMQIFSANHADATRLFLTEMHELTHYNLLTSTITGHVQAICDSMLSAVDAGPGREGALAGYGLSTDDYDAIADAYTFSIDTSRRVHETTACYSEFTLASKKGLADEYHVILAERADLYQLPLLRDCLLVDERLSPLFRSAALRGQVLYTLARLALDRRLVCPDGQQPAIGPALFSVLASVDSPDDRFGGLLQAFSTGWPLLNAALLQIDETFSRSMMWDGTSSDLFLALLSGPDPDFQKINGLENIFKELLYKDLGKLLLTDPFDGLASANQYYIDQLIPGLSRYIQRTKFKVRDEEKRVRVAKPRVSDPTGGDRHPQLLIRKRSSCPDLLTIFERMFDGDERIVRSTLIVHIAGGSIGLPDPSDTQAALIVPEGSLLATLLVASHSGEDDLQSGCEMVFFAEPATLWEFAGRLGSRLLAVIVSSAARRADQEARALSEAVPLDAVPVFLHPAGSLFVETMDDGAYALALPASVAFYQVPGGQADSLVLLKGSGAKAWMCDIVSELRLLELRSWAIYTASVSILLTNPFEPHVADLLFSACRSSLLRVPGL